MSTKTVQRHIAKLAEDKFVTVTARYSASKQASNMYQLTLDKMSTPSGQNVAPPLDKMSTPSGQNVLQNQSLNLSTEPVKEQKKAATAPKPKNLSWKKLNYSSWPALPDDDQMEAIMQNRKSKRGAMTQRAMDLIGHQLQEAVKTGLTPKNCFDEWELRGWVAFKAEWMQNAKQAARPSNFTGLDEVVHNEFDQTPQPGDVF